jgi:hypothetical protein
MQERLLSARVVHFASDQMYWECCEQRATELLPGIKFSEHLLTTDEGASLKMLARHTRSISEDNASDLLPLHEMECLKCEIFELPFDFRF